MMGTIVVTLIVLAIAGVFYLLNKNKKN